MKYRNTIMRNLAAWGRDLLAGRYFYFPTLSLPNVPGSPPGPHSSLLICPRKALASERENCILYLNEIYWPVSQQCVACFK